MNIFLDLLKGYMLQSVIVTKRSLIRRNLVTYCTWPTILSKNRAHWLFEPNLVKQQPTFYFSYILGIFLPCEQRENVWPGRTW